MNPLSPLPALAALFLLFACGWVVDRLHGTKHEPGRYVGIDGLRGFLAFFVFLHHSAYWYFFARTGQWGGIDSHLYNHFGQGGVMLFFMITAFLFGSKLIAGRERPIDWRRLFVSRFMRLTPLYLFAMLVLFTLVAVESGFDLRDSPAELLHGVMTWLGFSIFGEPDINGVLKTTELLAGVTWSLPYEWMFYLSLPLLGILIGLRPPLPWLAISIVGVALIIPGRDNLLAYEAFGGGLLAAFAVRSPWLRSRCQGPAASVLAVACLATAVTFFPSSYSRIVVVLMSVFFILVACGSTLFGLLATRAARTIGEMAYSLYLVHGALLAITFRYIVTIEGARQLTPLQHWLVILCCVPVLVALCALTYRFIEEPGIAAGKRIDLWLTRRSAISGASRQA